MTLPISITFPRYDGWRILNKGEVGAYTKPDENGMPQVRPSDWQDGLDFTYDLQNMSYNLMRTFNANITKLDWRHVYDERIAFTNFQSWNDATGKVCADFVTPRDTGAGLPKLMKVILSAGFIHGDAIGDRLVLRPGIHGVDASKAVPTVEQIINNNWYFYAVTWHDVGAGKVQHFPQGNGLPVVIPLVLSREVSYPLSWFAKWSGTALPDPLKYYS